MDIFVYVLIQSKGNIFTSYSAWRGVLLIIMELSSLCRQFGNENNKRPQLTDKRKRPFYMFKIRGVFWHY
jgi:hypothetical protein